MSKTTAWANSLLKLVFQGTAIANIADNAASAPLTSYYLSLHTADPGEAGSQTTNECAYTSYARVAVARTSGGWTVTDDAATLTAIVTFPESTGALDSETVTHVGIGTAASGAGILMYSGVVSPNIGVTIGISPQLGTGTTLTEQ